MSEDRELERYISSRSKHKLTTSPERIEGLGDGWNARAAQNETLIDPSLLEADLQERLDVLNNCRKRVTEEHLDGQAAVLERLLSDLKAGLWRKGI